MTFSEGFLAVAEKVSLMFLIFAVGFVCQKVKFMTEETNRNLSDIVIYIVMPCVIINAFSATVYEKEELLGVLRNIGLVALIAVIVHAVMIFCVHFLFRVGADGKIRVMRFATVFSNAGFIALPLAQALIDTPTSHEGVLYAAVYLAVFNVTLWTWGYSVMSGGGSKLNLRKILLNPGIISVVVGMFLFTAPLYIQVEEVSGIRLPAIVQEALSIMADLNLPLPMLMVGYYLGKSDLKSALCDGWSYLCVAFRLLVFPLATLGVLWICGVRGNVLTVSVIGAAAPVGASATMFAAKFGGDSELSARLVSLSTLLSLISLPLIVGFTQSIA